MEIETITDDERAVIRDILIDIVNGSINHYTCVSKLLMYEDSKSSYKYTELCIGALDTVSVDNLYPLLNNI